MPSPCYPPTHRRGEDPQPEVCQLCGLQVGGAHLREVGLPDGRSGVVCDVTKTCRMYSRPSRHDLLIEPPDLPDPTPPIYPHGAPQKWATP